MSIHMEYAFDWLSGLGLEDLRKLFSDGWSGGPTLKDVYALNLKIRCANKQTIRRI